MQRPPQLTDDQRHILAAAARHFEQTGSWPDEERVVRQALQAGNVDDPRTAIFRLPPSHGHVNSGKLQLTFEGIAASPHAATLLETFVKLARHAATTYLESDLDTTPALSYETVREALGLDATTVDRLHALLQREYFLTGSGSMGERDWRYEITPAAVEFREVTSVPEYLEVRRRVTQGSHLTHELPPDSVPTLRGMNRGRGAEHTLSAEVHPVILRRSVQQFRIGNYRAGVSESMLAIEVRVRELGGYTLDDIGVSLMNRAFGRDGPLRDPDAPKGEQEATRALFAGAFGAFRNPSVHRDEFPRQDAVEAVHLASFLMRHLDRLEEKLSSTTAKFG